MGSAASALDRTSPESLAALAESSGKPPIVASLVRQHFIDADTAILHLNEEALKEALATISEKSSPLALAQTKNALQQLKDTLLPSPKVNSKASEQRTATVTSTKKILETVSRPQMLRILQDEGVLTKEEGNAAQRRLLDASTTSGAAMNIVDSEEHGDLGTMERSGRTVTLQRVTDVQVGLKSLGILLHNALELAAKDEIDEIVLSDGRYQLQQGKGGVWTLTQTQARRKRRVSLKIRALNPINSDGERKRGVREDQIEGGGGGDDRDRDRDSRSSSKTRREGDRVKAKCTGWTKFYGGKITRANSDGTYDIKFQQPILHGGLKAVYPTQDDTNVEEDTVADTVAAASSGLYPSSAYYDVKLENISITNPGDMKGGYHESLIHGILIDGEQQKLAVLVAGCTVYGCRTDHGCGVAVRHHGWCCLDKGTVVRDCYVGIKVDSNGGVHLLQCEVYRHLASGLLLTNSLRAEAFADLLDHHDEDEEEKEEDEDGKGNSERKETSLETAKTMQLSQTQSSTSTSWSVIGDGFGQHITSISGCDDCGIVVSDGGRVRLLKGTNIFGNTNRGIDIEDPNTICSIHPMVSIHHNPSGPVFYSDNDGCILRRYRYQKKTGGRGTSSPKAQGSPNSKGADSPRSMDMEATWIEEPLQWWINPKTLFEHLQRDSAADQFKIAQLYIQAVLRYDGKRWFSSPTLTVSVNGKEKPVVLIGSSRPEKEIRNAQLEHDVWSSAGYALRWAQLALKTAQSESGGREDKELIKLIKQLLVKLKMMS
jgi:hypothetical protein